MLTKYISFPIFLLSFAIGLFFTYIRGVDMKVIYAYPTPENTQKYLYKDAADNCFKYNPVEVKCTKNTKNIPIQNADDMSN